ncbi:MAG: M48 family metallopeptidase [Candidatus Brocadiia bacterium]
MLLPFLLCVLIVYVPMPTSAAPPTLWAGMGGVLSIALLHVALCWMGSLVAIFLLNRDGPAAEMGASRVFTFLKGLMVGLTAAAVFGLGWPVVVERLLGARRWLVLADDLLLMLPALAMAVTIMGFQARVERRQGRVSIGIGRYLWLRFRIELGVVLMPWVVLVLLTDLAESVFWHSPHGELAGTAATGLILVGLVVASPALLRAVWRTTPLPDGALRERLEAFCRQHGFRCRDILLWHTHHHLANAGVIGPTPLLRYVLLSDALVARCSAEEVEAVFAHEIGHIRHHHLAFYLVFALGFLCFYAAVVEALAAAGLMQPLGHLLAFDMTLPQAVAMLAFAAFYWVVGFGFVSRRMEQEADLFSVAESADPEAFLRALDKLGALSHAPRRLSFWRHFSIQRRIEFLRRAAEDPSARRRFARSILALKLGYLAAFAACLTWLILARPGLFGV